MDVLYHIVSNTFLFILLIEVKGAEMLEQLVLYHKNIHFRGYVTML